MFLRFQALLRMSLLLFWGMALAATHAQTQPLPFVSPLSCETVYTLDQTISGRGTPGATITVKSRPAPPARAWTYLTTQVGASGEWKGNLQGLAAHPLAEGQVLAIEQGASGSQAPLSCLTTVTLLDLSRVGIHTRRPQQALDINGGLRLRELPLTEDCSYLGWDRSNQTLVEVLPFPPVEHPTMYKVRYYVFFRNLRDDWMISFDMGVSSHKYDLMITGIRDYNYLPTLTPVRVEFPIRRTVYKPITEHSSFGQATLRVGADGRVETNYSKELQAPDLDWGVSVAGTGNYSLASDFVGVQFRYHGTEEKSVRIIDCLVIPKKTP